MENIKKFLDSLNLHRTATSGAFAAMLAAVLCMVMLAIAIIPKSDGVLGTMREMSDSREHRLRTSIGELAGEKTRLQGELDASRSEASTLRGEKSALSARIGDLTRGHLETMTRTARLLANPEALIAHFVGQARVALVHDRELGPTGVILTICSESEPGICRAIARYAFSGGPEHFKTLAALARPALKPFAVKWKDELKEADPILSQVFPVERLRELRQAKNFACPRTILGEDQCKDATAAIPNLWGIEAPGLSGVQEYVVEFLQRRYDEGGIELVAAAQEFLLGLAHETNPQASR